MHTLSLVFVAMHLANLVYTHDTYNADRKYRFVAFQQVAPSPTADTDCEHPDPGPYGQYEHCDDKEFMEYKNSYYTTGYIMLLAMNFRVVFQHRLVCGAEAHQIFYRTPIGEFIFLLDMTVMAVFCWQRGESRTAQGIDGGPEDSAIVHFTSGERSILGIHGPPFFHMFLVLWWPLWQGASFQTFIRTRAFIIELFVA